MQAIAMEPEGVAQPGDPPGGGASRPAAEGAPAPEAWQVFPGTTPRGPRALSAFPTVAALLALQIGLGVLAVEVLSALLRLVG